MRSKHNIESNIANHLPIFGIHTEIRHITKEQIIRQEYRDLRTYI